MRAVTTALLSGLVFGVGLCVSGMTDPRIIVAFLDVAGKWSPNLAGVMVGAVAVHAAWLRWLARGGVGASASFPPARPRIDAALLVGAALFGVGWGLAGYCPGPAIVALGTGSVAPLVFVAAMVAGMGAHQALRSPQTSADPGPITRPKVSQS